MEVESRIESVVVFARGARIRRIAIVPASAGTSLVRLVGLPLAVIDDTARAEVQGDAVVHALRVAEDVVAETETEQSSDVGAARRRMTLAAAEADRLGRALDRLAAAPLVAEDPSEDGPAPWAAVVAARRQLIAMRAAREGALREALGAARRELDAAALAYDVVVESEARAGSARAAKLHEPRKYIELEVVATAEGTITLHVEYQVAAARWAPSYVARLDGEAVRFELRAVVAQDSGEDWLGVALRLSTAEPTRFAELPALAAQKIGRRQHEPAKKGFRPAPVGADELYRDYDHVFAQRIVETSFAHGVFDDSTYEGRAPTAPEVDGSVALDQVWDDESSNAMPSRAGAPQPQAKPRPAPATPVMMPMAMPAAVRSKSSKAGMLGGMLAAPAMFVGAAAQSIARAAAPGGGGGRSEEYAKKTAPSEPRVPALRLDYAGLVMAPPATQVRGRLVARVRRVANDSQARVANRISAIEQLVLPPGHAAAWDHAYDYAFASDGAVDICSDHAWHAIALTTRTGTAKLRHVAVPREQADVFRVATIANPLDGPLLPGPIDVYDRGQFLVTSEVDYTPPGGTVEVGLGVDAQIKIARNVEYHEEATGMLRGGLRLVHAIAIDVENLGTRVVELELRERVPIVREDDDNIEIMIGKVDPAWERWTPDPSAPKDERLRGAYRWRLAVAPSQKKVVRATYEVKIAGKHELIGGNRRES